jgi:hypothetical protein
MATKLTKFDELDISKVQESLEEITARIQEAHPTLDVKRGVFHDLVAYLNAALATLNQTNVDRYLSARSLKAIEDNPLLADDDTVDHVLSNFRLNREPGGVATGSVTLVISESLPFVFPVNSTFEADGKIFRATAAFASKTDPELVSGDSDRLLVVGSDGNFSWTVDVVAEVAGPEYNLKKGSLIVPDALPASYVTSYVTSDFIGGSETETNTELLGRLQEGLATKGLSNRVNMLAMLRDISAFSRVSASSIIGYGDSEMLRDQHTIWPMSLGGRVDWYIRSQDSIVRSDLLREATLIEKTNGDRGTWQFSLSKDDVPGFYEVRDIRLPGTEDALSGFDISQETRSMDLTGDGFIPDIETISEGAYSAFQAAIVQFEDTSTDTSGMTIGDKQEYDTEIWGLPLIGDIQTHVASRDVRNYGGDILVKAPVPCFVQLSFTITKRATEDSPVISDIKDALMKEVAEVGFIGRLYSSQLHDVIHGYLNNDANVSNIDMFGRIRYPDGTMKFLRSYELLEVPSEADKMVTAKTVQFFVESEDISISVESKIPEPL